jgi:hypothetical protein
MFIDLARFSVSLTNFSGLLKLFMRNLIVKGQPLFFAGVKAVGCSGVIIQRDG